MTRNRKTLPLKRNAVQRQLPLVELMRFFAGDSFAVRISVLLCALGGEILLSALICLMRLSLVAMLLLASGEGIKHGILALL